MTIGIGCAGAQGQHHSLTDCKDLGRDKRAGLDVQHLSRLAGAFDGHLQFAHGIIDACGF